MKTVNVMNLLSAVDIPGCRVKRLLMRTSEAMVMWREIVFTLLGAILDMYRASARERCRFSAKYSFPTLSHSEAGE